MNVKIENGILIISIPLQTPKLSSTGKTMIVATSGGTVKTGVEVHGKEVRIGLNAFIAKD